MLKRSKILKVMVKYLCSDLWMRVKGIIIINHRVYITLNTYNGIIIMAPLWHRDHLLNFKLWHLYNTRHMTKVCATYSKQIL